MERCTYIRMFLAAACWALVCATCSGCVTPVSVGPASLSIGIFDRISYADTDAVQAVKTEGMGLAFHERGISLGYIRIEEVVIDPGASPEGVLVATPRMTIATGARANAIAASEDAVAELLIHQSAPGALGVLP